MSYVQTTIIAHVTIVVYELCSVESSSNICRLSRITQILLLVQEELVSTHFLVSNVLL